MSRFITETGWYLISLNKDEMLSDKVNSITQIDKTSTINNAYLVSENKKNLPAPSHGDFTNGNWESVPSSYTATSSLGIWVYATVSVAKNWEQTGVSINGEAANDKSGTSVSLNSTGDIVAIGSPVNDSVGVDAGQTRIYQKNSEDIWEQLGSDINGQAEGDQSGKSVSLNSAGDIVAIGSPRNDSVGEDAGQTRIFIYSDGSWTQLGSDINGERANDQSGTSVSLNSAGDIVAIGAPLNDRTGVGNAGHTRIYQYVSDTWSQIGQDIDGEATADLSGISVSLNSAGDIVAIGAYLNDGSAVSSGHTRIYQYDFKQNLWTQIGNDIDGDAIGDISGSSVSLNSAGDIVAIGAPANNGNGSDSGQTKIFQYTDSSWTQLGADIYGKAAGDESGTSVSLNSDGNIVAIGSPINNIGGSSAGQTRIFQYNGTSWVQLSSDINGEAANDESGTSVSLNSAGDIVSIGAPNNNNGGTESGQTRIFSI